MRYGCCLTFIRKLDVLGKVATGMAVDVIYGRFRCLILQKLWPDIAELIKMGQISSPGLLEPMLGSGFTHSINPKGFTYP